MENREQQILSEIKSMMASIRSQLELLDAKMAELQQVVDPEVVDLSPIDIDIADASSAVPLAAQVFDVQEKPLAAESEDADEQPSVAEEPGSLPAVEPVTSMEIRQEIMTEDDLPAADVPAAAPEDDLPAAEDDDDLPSAEETMEIFVEDAPVMEIPSEEPIVPEVVAENISADGPMDGDDRPEGPQTVIDAMTDRQAWRTDMPGTPVRDIRSAISLNDRILFINYLFKEDPMAFQNTLSNINTMDTLEEVVEYVRNNYPGWDLESDVVYRFMMAVRRRIRQ